MDRFTEVYETINNAKGAWTFNDDGNIKDNIMLVNTLDIIDALNWIIDEDEIAYLDSIVDDCEYLNWHNTYNWDAKVTHDIDVKFIEHNNEVIACAKFHISGDIRANYTDYLYFNCGGAGYANKYNAIIEFYFAMDDVVCESAKTIEHNGYTFVFEPKPTDEAVYVYCNEVNDETAIYEYEITDDVLNELVSWAENC